MRVDLNTASQRIVRDLNVIERREFLKVAIAAGLVSTCTVPWGGCRVAQSNTKARIVIIGGGAAGLSMAVRLRRLLKQAPITLIDPAETHFYQPGFTLIASGVYQPDQVWKKQKGLIPAGINWVKSAVVAVDPGQKQVVIDDGHRFSYDFLVLTPGIQCNWEQVEGITRKTLGKGNAHSIYDFEGAQKTWPAIQAFVDKGGRGIFTDTYTKHKCGGAPKKICLLTEHLARKRQTRGKISFHYFTGSKELYDVPHFTSRLVEIYKERSVPVDVRVKLMAVDTEAKKAYFTQSSVISRKVPDSQGGFQEVEEVREREFSEEYEFLHFAPPQSAPDFVRSSGLGWDEGPLAREAWIMADKETLVHKRHPNIVSFGDASGIPTSKTSAAIRKQIPIAVTNLLDLIAGQEPSAIYDGYAACPIITDYGHVILAEFDYQKNPRISFPLSLFDMSKEQRAAWWLKVYALKPLYFYGMLKGIW